jgi:tetratricopeptide (TPR) repeat protein
MNRQALEIRQRLFPGDSPDVAQSLNDLAIVLQSRGDSAAAEPLLREALAMRRRVAPDSRRIPESLSPLAEVCQSLGKYVEAEAIWREVLKIHQGALPPGDWRTSSAQSALGGALLAQSKFVEAEPLLLEGFRGIQAGKDTPPKPKDALPGSCERLVKLYEAWDSAEPGKGHDAQALQWREKRKALDVNTPSTTRSAS